jgi:ABC-type oligopeptide transport system substrate-binding subunit
MTSCRNQGYNLGCPNCPFRLTPPSPRTSRPRTRSLRPTSEVTGDSSKRAELLEQAEQVLLREMPVLPIYFGVAKIADLANTHAVNRSYVSGSSGVTQLVDWWRS